MLQRLISGWVLIFGVMTWADPTHAQGRRTVGSGSYSKRGGNENVRWTLGDWLTQKRTFSLADQWLAVNTQSQLIEYGFEYGRNSYEVTINGQRNDRVIERASAQFWVSIFGIQYTREDSDEEWLSQSGQLNVRLLGQSSRSTNLTAFYGVRDWKDKVGDGDYQNQFAGGRLNLYLVSFLGIEGQYRKDFSAQDNSNRDYESERSEYGAFIDLDILRLYGNVFRDIRTVTTSGVPSREVRDGIDAGVRLYF
jgi:hypothetical protein